MLNRQTHTQSNDDFFQRDFHGAAIIDNKGHEIPMTAEMIDAALEQLSRELEKQPKKYSFTAF